MKTRLHFWSSAVYLGALLFCGCNKVVCGVRIRGVLLDSGLHDAAMYANFVKLAGSVEIDVQHRPLDSITELSSENLIPQDTKIVFLNVGLDFLKSMRKPALGGKVLETVSQWSKKKGSVTVLMFPPLGIGAVDKFAYLKPLFNAVGVTQKPKTLLTARTSLDDFIGLSNAFLSFPLEFRSFAYHTMLSSPRSGRAPNFPYPKKADYVSVTPLPYMRTGGSDATRITLPYGIYFYNESAQNHVVVSSSSLLSFSGVTENFQFLPFEPALRTQLHELVQQFLWELRVLAKDANSPECIGFPVSDVIAKSELQLPSLLVTKPFSKESLKKIRFKSGINKTAWMETTLFERPRALTPAEEREVEDREDKLILYIFDAKLDALWLSISPNMYYSPIARKKAGKDIWLDGLGRFTDKLRLEWQKRGVPLPKILAGFEIANNLYENGLPKKPAYDCYGNKYEDVPSPLDWDFWNNEIFIPLKAFYEDWKRTPYSHQLPLSGIVIDFEMYGRKSTSVFSSTMGFDRETIKKFGGIDVKADDSITDLVDKIVRSKNMQKYKRFLQVEAKNLGKLFSKRVSKFVPGATVSCYAPNISLDWFYKGFYEGLGSRSHLFTFTSRFDLSRNLLAKKGILSSHSGVLMLSKLRDTADFEWVDKVFYTNHDSKRNSGGVWLNRFSRMVEPFQKEQWYTVEQTSMKGRDKELFCRYLSVK